MDARERLLRVFRGEKPDRMPWAPLIDSYFLDAVGYTEDDLRYLDFCESLGVDQMLRHVPVVRYEYDDTIQRAVNTLGGGLERITLETPEGSITQVIEHHHGTDRWHECYIKTADDLRVFQYVEEHKTILPDYSYFKEVDATLGYRGIATVGSPATPLAMMLEIYVGLENLVYLLYDEREAVEDCMRAMHRNHLIETRYAAQSPAPVVMAYEDTSTTTISLKMYRDYCQQQLGEYCDVVRQAGKPYIVHMCGKLFGFRDLIAETRCDGIDSLCPPDTGDIELWEGRAYWPEKLLIGGIDPSALVFCSAQQLTEKVTRLQERTQGMSGLILCTGDAVAHNTPVENLKLVSNLMKQ